MELDLIKTIIAPSIQLHKIMSYQKVFDAVGYQIKEKEIF
jgi:hypothetical protein